MKERTPSQVEASLRAANLTVKTIFETLGKDGAPLWSDTELKAIDAWISPKATPRSIAERQCAC